MTAFLSHQLVEPGFGQTRIWDLNDIPADTSIEALLTPANWANVAAKLKVGDEIIVKPQGLPYRAHLIVLDAGKAFAKTRILDVTMLNDTAAPAVPKADEPPASLADDAPVFVKWNGPKDKYAVFRKSDKEKLRADFGTNEDAVTWAVNHVAAMAP